MDGFDWVVGEITALTYIVTPEYCFYISLLVSFIRIVYCTAFFLPPKYEVCISTIPINWNVSIQQHLYSGNNNRPKR